MNLKIFNQPLGQCDLSGGYAPAKKRIWPAVIMAATAIGSAIYSGAKSSAANKRAQSQLDAEKGLTVNERRRKMNENPLDRADAQNLIRLANDEANKIYKKEAGNAAMTGATERTAMAKQYGNNLVGEAIANIAANDAQRKDRIDERYSEREHSLRQQQIALDQQKAIDQANTGAQLISGLGSAAAAYAGTYMGQGSPGGAGVTAAPKAAGSTQLDNMGGGSSTDINPYQLAMQDPNFARQYGIKYYSTSKSSLPDYNFGAWISQFMGTNKRN